MDRHFTSQELAQYVDVLVWDNEDELPEEILEHAAECPVRKIEIVAMIEVLGLDPQRLNNMELSRKLLASRISVETQAKIVFHKLDIHDRQKLVLKAQKTALSSLRTHLYSFYTNT